MALWGSASWRTNRSYRSHDKPWQKERTLEVAIPAALSEKFHLGREKSFSQTKVLNLKQTQTVTTEAITAQVTETNYNPLARRLLRLFVQPTSFFTHLLATGVVAAVVLASIYSGSAARVLSAQDVQLDPEAVPLTIATMASASNIPIPAGEINPTAELATAETGFLKAPAAAATEEKQVARPFTHIVKAGETPVSIASAHGISVETVLMNNSLSRRASLSAGMELTLIPISGVIHQSAGGETVESLAIRYKAPVSEIIATNAVDQDSPLPAGLTIVIPSGKRDISSGTTSPSTTSVVARASSVSSGNSFPWGYCTWWVAAKRHIPWRGNAGEWYRNAQSMGYAVGKTPKAGAIYVSWESPYYGHAGYVESVNSYGTYTISEMNFVGFGVVNNRTITPGTTSLIGFIY